MKRLILPLVLSFVSASLVHAQSETPSSWGVVGGFVPTWKTTSSVDQLATLVFSENSGPLDFRGSEFRIGIARGRLLAGDWGVSFVQKTFADDGPLASDDGSGCGGTTVAGAWVLDCERYYSELTPNNIRLTGVEVHKFISFVTFSRRVQVGLNVAGGIAVGKGTFDSRSFRSTFKCTFPPGVEPSFSGDDPCEGGTVGPETITQTGTSVEDFTRLLTYSSNRVPLGKVEIAVAAIVAPRVKVRLTGGMNYPGVNTIAIAGVYLFSDR